MKTFPRLVLRLILFCVTAFLLFPQASMAEEAPAGLSIDQQFDKAMAPIADFAAEVVFWAPIKIGSTAVPLVLVLLAGTAIFLTIYFRFINLRGFGIAIKTAKGKYTSPDAPGQITHFQALSTALSATVGLGNIAGVAVAVGLGGPGATFWMIVLGLCGMTTKFAECTLGVKYRKIDAEGRVHGGAMYYLSEGLKAEGKGKIGEFMSALAPVLSVLFAIFVIGGAFGAGNMFQANQAYSQFSGTFAPNLPGWVFGLTMAVLVGLVIIGGIVSIARVTSILVPFMCAGYIVAALFIIFANISHAGEAFVQIFQGAFDASAVAGGIVGVLIQGIQRAAFSNEAGLGSAPIAHSAVKTDKPASEGFVALLEPFTDTVVVCTMTALVIIISGTWKVRYEVEADVAQLMAQPGAGEVVQEVPKGQFLQTRNSETVGDKNWVEVINLVSSEDYSSTKISAWADSSALIDRKGVPVTSMAFQSVIGWFPALLTIAVFLFAFSTMISWSYYGQQGVYYLAKGLGDQAANMAILVYRLVFCLAVIFGASASFNSVITLSDSMVFAMVLPNLIGLYFLLHVVRREADDYLSFVKSTDGKP